VLRVVTRRKQNEARLERLAGHDDLTGHPNRHRMREVLDQLLADGQRCGSAAGVYLAVGLDKLSLINDAYGAAAADAAVVATGQRLERIIHPTDTIGRVGGDVYGLALRRCREDEMPLLAERILRSFRETPVETPAGPVPVTVWVGGISLAGFAQTGCEAMTRAEAAMYEARRLGREGFMMYQLTEQQRLNHRRALAVGESFLDAMKDDRLRLAFQPVVDQRDGRIAFYESLLRMVSRDGTIVAAGAFVPVVEQLGLARLMDRRVLDLAMRELTAYPGIHLAINISTHTTTDQGWLDHLAAVVRHRRDVAERLIVEITETAAIQDLGETARFVASLRELGCRVALDDFGAGYTSFRQFRALAVDIVKIDGLFVRTYAATSDSKVFVRTLIDLARNFGRLTVAECVETAADAEALKGVGVDYLQGFYFGKPTLDRPWLAGAAAPAPPAALAAASSG